MIIVMINKQIKYLFTFYLIYFKPDSLLTAVRSKAQMTKTLLLSFHTNTIIKDIKSVSNSESGQHNYINTKCKLDIKKYPHAKMGQMIQIQPILKRFLQATFSPQSR